MLSRSLEDIRQRNANSNFIPSPIIMINGQDAASWVLYQALNTSSSQHDPDAMYAPLPLHIRF
jgi:hypothetical protein